MSASLGGLGGGGGHGEHVNVTTTARSRRSAIMRTASSRESIGGGGGSGGFSVAGSFSKPASRPAGPNGTKNLDFSVGGQGGAGDAGGDVDVTNAGRIDAEPPLRHHRQPSAKSARASASSSFVTFTCSPCAPPPGIILASTAMLKRRYRPRPDA